MKDRLYNTGMQLADCLRLLGKHEESAQIERWVLAMVREIEAKPQRGAEQMKKTVVRK